jgi:hypothetical protein
MISEPAVKLVDSLRATPGLLFLTLLNISFLIFTYFLGSLVLQAYNRQQDAVNDRFKVVLATVDRCVDTAFKSIPVEHRT